MGSLPSSSSGMVGSKLCSLLVSTVFGFLLGVCYVWFCFGGAFWGGVGCTLLLFTFCFVADSWGVVRGLGGLWGLAGIVGFYLAGYTLLVVVGAREGGRRQGR